MGGFAAAALAESASAAHKQEMTIRRRDEDPGDTPEE
jgi:hypothetical protein